MDEELNMQPVESSAVQALGYLNGLFVEYRSGKTYYYPDVPEWVYRDLLEAQSIGQTLNKLVLRPGYKYRLIG